MYHKEERDSMELQAINSSEDDLYGVVHALIPDAPRMIQYETSGETP
jgi:hypothetical protein